MQLCRRLLLQQRSPLILAAAQRTVAAATDSSCASQALATALHYHKQDKVLKVHFASGETFSFSAELLRIASPSADNKALKPDGRPKVVAGRRHVGIMSIDPVGSYAVRLLFDDLHRTGIYTWDYLHELGRTRFAVKRSYIRQLRQQGLSRDPAPAAQHRGTGEHKAKS